LSYRRILLLVVLAAVVLTGCGRKYYRDCTAECENSYDIPIVIAAADYDLEPELIKAVIWRESKFNKECEGGKGELGLMQVMPSTADDWAQRNKRPPLTKEELLTPEMNINIGSWYLAWCSKRFPEYEAGRTILLLACYNAGHSRVREWLPQDTKKPMTLEDIQFPSTRSYVKQILERMELYKNRKNF